jgi:hypothetical protein
MAFGAHMHDDIGSWRQSLGHRHVSRTHGHANKTRERAIAIIAEPPGNTRWYFRGAAMRSRRSALATTCAGTPYATMKGRTQG